MTETLKLRAETKTDVEVFSSALQDSITRVNDIRYSTSGHNLTMRVSRYRHEKKNSTQRVLAGLRIDGVLSVKSKGIDQSNPEALTVLLALDFVEDGEEPGGTLKLIFAGGGELAVAIECIDMTLADVSIPRDTDKRPLHPEDI